MREMLRKWFETAPVRASCAMKSRRLEEGKTIFGNFTQIQSAEGKIWKIEVERKKKSKLKIMNTETESRTLRC